MRFMVSGVIVVVMFLFSSLAFAQVYKADMRKGEIKIDGKLDEDAWKNATVYSDFNLLKSMGGGKPKVDTSFRILKDENAVYLGIRCEEPYMDKLRDAFLPRDSSFWERDSVEIFMDPTGKGLTYYHFAVTVSNSQYDAYWIEGGHTQGGYYSSLWDSAVFRGKDYWSCEVKIPLYCFYYTDSTSFSDVWLVNVTRERYTEWELSTWSLLEKGFLEVKNFRKFIDMPVKNPVSDLKVGNAEVDIKDENLRGDLIIKINAAKKAAGLRDIKVYDGEKEIGSKKITLKEGDNSVKIENIEFGKKGNKEISIVVLSGNEKVLGIIQKINISYEKLGVEIEKPFYANCIFPGQKIKNIEGKVYINVPQEKIKNAKLEIELKGENLSRKMDLEAGKTVGFKIKADDLKEGSYNLAVELKGKEGLIEKKEIKIRKLPKPEKGNYIYIDENLNFVVNGKPVYMREWYGGYGYLVSQAIRNKYGDKPDSKFVNEERNCWAGLELERLGEYIWDPEFLAKYHITREELQKVANEEVQRIKQDVEPHQFVYNRIEYVIEKAKDKPQTWLYYLSDEPECRMVSPVYLTYMYKFVKEKDPYHPVMIITRDPEMYTTCADILNPHPYVSPSVDDSGKRKLGVSIREIKNEIREVYESGKNRIPAWCTPQACTFGYYDRFADYPTFDEFNSMVWTAVTNGAKGFTPYIYYDHLNCVDLRLGADFIYETLANLEEFLFTHPDDKLKFENKNRDIDVLIKEKDGKILLIAVNMTDKNQADEIYSKGLSKIKKLYGFRENTVVDVKSGKIKLDFYPYQVHMFTYPEMGKDLKKVEVLKKEIDDIKEGFKKKGNILYGKGRQIEFNSSDTYLPNLFLSTLCDGMTDTAGWIAWVTPTTPQNPSFVEMRFLDFVPEFKRLKVYSATIQDMGVYIWKKGDWEKIAEIKDNKDDVIEFKFDEKIRAVKMKLLITKVKPGTRAEVYEVEMYEN